MKTYKPRDDDAERSPWRRGRPPQPSHDELAARREELAIDAREYRHLAADLAETEAARTYRTRANAAEHLAAAIAAYLERESPRA